MTLPVILKNERKINLFLRTEDIDLINEINKETILQQPEARFAWLRSKKDTFLIILTCHSLTSPLLIGRLLSNY